MSDRILWGMLVGVAAGVASIFGVFLVALLAPRKKCPDCGTPLSKLRNCWDTPGAVRRCDECGCRVNIRGQRVKKKSSKIKRSPSPRDYEIVEEDIQPNASSRPARRPIYHDYAYEDDRYDETPRRRREARSSSNAALWITLGVLGGVLLVGFLVVAIVIAVHDEEQPPNFVGNDGPAAPPVLDAPPPPPEDLGPKERLTTILGGAFDPTFKDEGPPNSVLTGFDVGLGKFLNLDVVKSIQPRYRTPQGETTGRKFGLDISHKVQVHAKPGYAVGGIQVKAGLLVNGFSVTFMRDKGGTLDPNDMYSSAWIGDKTGGDGPILLGGDGTPIVGVIGKRNNRDCNGLGLLKKR